MKYINTRSAITAALILMFSGLSSCKKETNPAPSEIQLSLPSQVSLRYGETREIKLSDNLFSAAGLTFSFDFSQAQDVNIGNGYKLSDRLNQAIKYHSESQSIQINSALLYPNGAQSIDARIPDEYRITLVAKESHGAVVAKESFSLKINSGTIGIKGLKSDSGLPYSYVLYSDQATVFEIDPLGLPTAGASFHLKMKDGQEHIASIVGANIKLSKDAGDPEKKAEQSFELTPELRKDGFPVASTTLRVILIPQIKFLFGQYYPDLNLTIDFSLLHIGLSNGYVSAAPTLYPEKYKSTFELVSIQKDGLAFADTEKLFSVNTQTGEITVKKSESLMAGSYKITIKALTTTGLEFVTSLTLVMSAG
ncbi:hypothetical protein [Sphingobacterium thalpophilum]|uniref:hypothetical protein n=1 Tax=Sphingobacterium thalpophilum TaxID=259 RepID=UPI0024A73F49|nr:hypothetical protein [Sphingobacterium thalpophilum]